jgi:hypothetical protein
MNRKKNARLFSPGIFKIIFLCCGAAKLSFNAHRDAHAAADTQRGEGFFGIALLHLVQQRH